MTPGLEVLSAETKGTDGRGLPCSRPPTWRTRHLLPDVHPQPSVWGESGGWGQALSQPAQPDPTPIPGSPTACGKPTSSLSGSWAPNPNPIVKTLSCPRTHENPLYYPSEGGKLWIK